MKRALKTEKSASLTATAKALGVSRQLIEYHSKKRGSPPAGDTEAWGHYLAAVGRQGSAPAELRQQIATERLQLLAAMRRREEIRLAKDEGKMLAKDEVAFAVAKTVSALFADLDRHFLNELPPALKGLDEPAIASTCREVIEKLKADFRAGLEAIARTDNETEPQKGTDGHGS